jgi:hypothetical protein
MSSGDGEPERVPSRVTERARILRLAPLEPEIERALFAALTRGGVEGGSVLKEGRVWRLGAVVIKRYPAMGTLRGRLRMPHAVRAARAAQELGVERTPRALAAVWEKGLLFAGASVLATEHVEGCDLHRALLAPDEAAQRAFPGFLADLHERGIHHGDLHPWQLLWNGERWFLLDLDGLRHPLRALRREHLELEAWARLLFYGRVYRLPAAESSLERLFHRYLELRRPGHDPVHAWSSVRDLADRLALSRRIVTAADE